MRTWKTLARLGLLVVVLLACNGQANAAPRLAGVFGDHMVLQREAPVPIWGWAEPGEQITVEFAGQTKAATADATGAWQVKLDSMSASAEPRTLTIRSQGARQSAIANLQFKDVLVGDVWLCSGQSNMAYSMSALRDTAYAPDLASAINSLIRQGLVPRVPAVPPTNNVAVPWAVCSPETVGTFTAAGYYFAREVQPALGVPIGLIHSSWGGTSAESWASKESLDTVPGFKKRAAEQLANLEQLPEQIRKFPAALAAWESANSRVDAANLGETSGWAKPDADTHEWQRAELRTPWKNLGLTNGGVIWLRKEIELPPSATSKGFRLDLGLVDEQCVTAYWNGEKLGESGRKPPQFSYGYQNFDVPARLLKPGRNVFALRFVTHTGDRSSGSRRAIQMGFLNAGLREMSDDCLVKIEKQFPPLTKAALAARPAVPKGDAAHTPSALFGGMIQPLIPFAIKGALWYQGEQDASRGFAYRTLLPLMIRDWRTRWGREFPFLIQQLPNWIAGGATNTEWAELREAQALTAKNVPNCGIAVGIDIGEANDVHPKNKRDVGHRLALVALEKVYGKPVEGSGPVFDSMTVEGTSIRLQFTHAAGLKSSDGGPLKGFAIAGKDHKFIPAQARIDDEAVVVSSPQVARPVAVRYAFVNNPEGCNLSNTTGLPAMPFRTDTWPGATDKNP